MSHFLNIFSENYFFKIYFLGLSIHFLPLEVAKKYFENFYFFHPILPYFTPLRKTIF